MKLMPICAVAGKSFNRGTKPGPRPVSMTYEEGRPLFSSHLLLLPSFASTRELGKVVITKQAVPLCAFVGRYCLTKNNNRQCARHRQHD